MVDVKGWFWFRGETKMQPATHTLRQNQPYVSTNRAGVVRVEFSRVFAGQNGRKCPKSSPPPSPILPNPQIIFIPIACPAIILITEYI